MIRATRPRTKRPSPGPAPRRRAQVRRAQARLHPAEGRRTTMTSRKEVDEGLGRLARADAPVRGCGRTPHMTRFVAPFALGLSLAAVALAACSSLDPHPPDPHNQPDPLTATD